MDEEFTNQYTTTTSATVRREAMNTTIRLNASYIYTLPGLLKIVQLIFNFVGFLCVIVTVYDVHVGGRLFNTVAMTGFSISGILLSFYVSNIIGKFQQVPWIKIEFIHCVVFMISNLISAAFMTTYSVYSASLGAAAFFGFSAMVAYGADAWLKYLAYKRGET